MTTINEMKNLILFTIGEPDEIDFTDTTIPLVQKVNRIYDTGKDFVLSNYNWRFVQKRAKGMNPIEETDTFTADAGTDFITPATADRDLFDGLEVTLTTTGTLPAGLALSTAYYTVNTTTTTAQLSFTLGGTEIDITDTGTGTHTITYEAVKQSPYKYLFDTPDDLLALRHAYTDKENLSPINDFELNNDGFLTSDIDGSDRSIRAWYNADIAEDFWPGYFVDYFRFKMALDVAFNLTGDESLIKMLAAQETRMLLSAKNIDAKQVKSRTIKSSPFTQIRN